MKKIFFLLMTLGWLSAIQAQWIQQNSGTTENLNDVFCITADTVVVVGDNGTILRTTNGGTLWSPVTSPASVNLHRVEFADAQTGYAVGDNGTLLKTTDAGQTWQSLNTGTNENLLALSCVAADTLYVAGGNGLVKKSTDAGQTWQDISIPNLTDIIKKIQFIGNTGYVITGQSLSRIFKTTSFGTNWMEISNNNYFDEFVWINSSTGYFGGSGYYYSDNSLSSVVEIGLSNVGNISDLIYINGNLWSVESDATVSTSDYNNYIVNIDINTLNQSNAYYYDVKLNSICFADEQNGYLVGNGKIFKNSTGLNYFSGSNVSEISKNIFSISPNPAKNQVFINLKDNSNQYPAQYRITDMQGKTLTAFKNLQDKEAVDVSRLTNGIYLIQVQTQGQVYTQKLLIQK